MPSKPDPVSELTVLMERSRQLLAELRSIEGRLQDVASRIALLSGHPAPAAAGEEHAATLPVGHS
jgi:hypothetical protein